MRFKKVESCDLLLKEDPRVIEEQLIDYVIYNREELKIASLSINSKIAPIRKFYECNDIELRWKKIKSYVGRNKGKGGTGRKKMALGIEKDPKTFELARVNIRRIS
jgi:hypothetical protein